MSPSPHLAFRHAQLCAFFSNALLYPQENWLDDVPLLAPIAADLGVTVPALDTAWSLADLQREHRRCFGLVGSLCYETEFGLPHEYRQSQEMADIAGFYRAFGFNVGGPVRERADHLATELEFLSVLALKEARAQDVPEHLEICADARRKFLAEHVGVWVDAFAQSLAHSAGASPYLTLAQWVVAYIHAEAARLNLTLEPRPLKRHHPTPPPQPMNCGDCPLAEGAEESPEIPLAVA
jgi:TorA maturation chaperone TorD